MSSKSICSVLILSLVLVVSSSIVFSAEKDIKLVSPDKTGGIPLMSALNNRHTSRSFSNKQLSDQIVSNILWSAFGTNRSDKGKRTAPSAMNKQEIEIFVSMQSGLYKYNAGKHSLELIEAKDLRTLAGLQGFVKDAPLNLIYVADMSKTGGKTKEDKMFYAGADTGFIGENVYLYCASEGLSTVIRANIDKNALGKAMHLKDDEMITLSQTVGYPGK